MFQILITIISFGVLVRSNFIKLYGIPSLHHRSSNLHEKIAAGFAFILEDDLGGRGLIQAGDYL